MRTNEFQLQTSDGHAMFTRSFMPDSGEPRAVVQIIHGLVEHSGRYARLAEALTARGYAAYAADHRGHGRTARPEDLGYLGDGDGFRHMMNDQSALLSEIARRHPGRPRVVLGHSMGSYVARALAAERGSELAALVLSGSSFGRSWWIKVLRTPILLERLRLGRRGQSPLVQALTTGSFNREFRPNRTHADWLSRDESEVDAYVEDPLCGHDPSVQLWWDLLGGLAYVCTARCLRSYPRALPILILAGENDPTLEDLSGLRKMQRAYRKAGLQHVTTRVYPGARHEVFNEINRDEVTTDLLEWLQTALP